MIRMPRIKITRKRIIALSGVFLLSVGLFWLAGSLLLAPNNHSVVRPESKLPIEPVSFETSRKNLVHGWFCQNGNSEATLILLHPNRADRTAMLTRAELFFQHGYSVLLIDLQGHGESQGDCITAGYLERHDVVAAVNFVKQKMPESKVGLVGRSLGGAAVVLGKPIGVDAVVLESVYPTITQAIHNRIERRLGGIHHLVAPAMIAQLEYRLGIKAVELAPVNEISELNSPVLIASGDMDSRTPWVETEELFQSAREPKVLLRFHNAKHEDLYRFDPELYRKKVLEFLSEYLQSNQG